MIGKIGIGLLAMLGSLTMAGKPAFAQQQRPNIPNIMFIMGVDIGWK